MAHRGVLMLPSFYDAIKILPDNSQLLLYDAIMRYGLYGELVDLPPELQGSFILMKPNIDASINRYNASIENGKKGGAPLGNKNAKKHNSLETTKEQPENNQDYDYDYNYDFDYDKERDFKGETKLPQPYQPMNEDAFEKERQRKMKMLVERSAI